MAKTETAILKNRFKKVYSVYSQALTKTIMDYDGSINCFYPEDSRNAAGHLDECGAFFSAFAKNLKISKKCDNNALAKGCIPEYDDFASVPGCSSFNGSYMSVNSTAYVLNDGSLFILFQKGSIYPLILVDVNGINKPNFPGKDVFTFSLHNFSGAYKWKMDVDEFNCFTKYAEDGYKNLADINN